MFVLLAFILLALSHLSHTTKPQDIPNCVKIDTFDPSAYGDVTNPDDFPKCFCDIRDSKLTVQCMYATTVPVLDEVMRKVAATEKHEVHSLILQGSSLGTDVLTRTTMHGVKIVNLLMESCFESNRFATDAFLDSANSMINITLKDCKFDPPVVPEAFMPLTNVRNLTLLDNYFQAIGRDVLHEMRQLRVLRMTGASEVVEIFNETFVSLSMLEELDLSGNKLKDEIWSEIGRLENLQTLKLFNTRVEKIPTDVIGKLAKLRHLDLTHTGVEFLQADTFRNLTNLQYLSLGNTLLRSLKANTFRGLSNLLELRLGISYIDNIDPGAFSGLDNLKQLSLSWTDIHVLERGVFSPLKQLVHLDLGELKNLVDIEPGALDIPNLEMLQLSNSGINFTDIRGDMFSLLNGLQTLDLSGSAISTIAADSFQNLTHLKNLWLNKTALRTLPEGLFGGISHNWENIDLSDNDWICDASLAWLPEWIQSMSNKTSLNLLNWENFQCRLPTELNGQVIVGLNLDAFLANFSADPSASNVTTTLAGAASVQHNYKTKIATTISPTSLKSTTPRSEVVMTKMSSQSAAAQLLQANEEPKDKAKFIIPIVVGAIVFLAMVAIIIIVVRRRQKQKSEGKTGSVIETKVMENGHATHSVAHNEVAAADIASSENGPASQMTRRPAAHQDDCVHSSKDNSLTEGSPQHPIEPDHNITKSTTSVYTERL